MFLPTDEDVFTLASVISNLYLIQTNNPTACSHGQHSDRASKTVQKNIPNGGFIYINTVSIREKR